MPSTSENLAFRIRQVRRELYGEDGITELAEALGLPARTWRNIEDGVKVTGEVLLRFLVLTGAEPHWLLTGEGDAYRSASVPAEMAESEASQYPAQQYA
jgi:hypothetical protein